MTARFLLKRYKLWVLREIVRGHYRAYGSEHLYGSVLTC